MPDTAWLAGVNVVAHRYCWSGRRTFPYHRVISDGPAAANPPQPKYLSILSTGVDGRGTDSAVRPEPDLSDGIGRLPGKH